MKYPRPLEKGSRIAVTAFSSGVCAPFHQRLDIVKSHLLSLGFEVVEGQCLRHDAGHVSASAEQRAQELMQFLCDETIAAIAPPWGGEFAMDVLPLLDYEKLKTVEPKWLFGFSDVSTLSVALTSKLGWSTAHSPNLMEMHPSETDALTAKTLHWLTLSEGSHFSQKSSDYYQLSGSSFATHPNATLNKTEPSSWKILGTDNGLVFSGRLVGGCFDTLLHLVGTDYFDIETLRNQYRDDGIILYLENAEMSPTVLKRSLQGFKNKGVFDDLKGFLFGRNAVTDNCGKDISSREAFVEVAESLNIPIVYDVDIGHLPPNMTLLNGAYAEVRVNAGKGEIKQTLKP
ncbi:S66 peptidase family protein [Pleionea sp. CnH1-48]|uniref:S66 family peptidase n=1 Tax=Pleionea sp. CnH1-48 TaxID=2954494 RepID=UPI002097F14B|nr:S66 peptidase family protein [Pleionea sp. CnH1-48]MCO7226616.1 LD-carboxypeptidase [Pleionea sp. CnH1-48]